MCSSSFRAFNTFLFGLFSTDRDHGDEGWPPNITGGQLGLTLRGEVVWGFIESHMSRVDVVVVGI